METEIPLDKCLDEANTSWMLIATVLVLGMMPALGFFESGLLRKHNTLSIISQVFSGLCVMIVMWYLFGFSLVFGNDHAGIIGDFSYAVFLKLEGNCIHWAPTIPGQIFALFQMMFASITPLLITGAFAERLKFRTFFLFIIVWEIVVYYPVAHWIWGGGFLYKLGVLDFAGGITIHTSAGISSLIVAAILGRRKNFDKHNGTFPSHNIPLAAVGGALLIIGWMGFNGGSSFGVSKTTAYAVTNTSIASAVGGLVWLVACFITHKHANIVEIINGMICALAGITPASGFIPTRWAGVAAFIISVAGWYSVILLKQKLKIDDALDVSSVHGVSGMVGALLIGVFASKEVNPKGANGLVYGGGGTLLWKQLVGILVALAWSGLVTFVLVFTLKKTTKLFHPVIGGLDKYDHGEHPAYHDYEEHPSTEEHLIVNEPFHNEIIDDDDDDDNI